MRKAKTIAAVLAATVLTVAGCSGSAQNAEGGGGAEDTTQNTTELSSGNTSEAQDAPDPDVCATEVSIKALLDQMPEELVGLPYDLSLIHISEPTRREWLSRMPSSA